MNKVKVRCTQFVAFLFVFMTVSIHGKKYILRMISRRSNYSKVSTHHRIFALKETLAIANSFLLCDKTFNKYIKKEARAARNRTGNQIYNRLVPYAVFCVILFQRLLDAFHVKYDSEGIVRATVFSFIHREWNDLVDHYGYSISDLYEALDADDCNDRNLLILANLSKTIYLLIPPSRFENYWKLRNSSHEIANLQSKHTIANARDLTAKRAGFACALYCHIFSNDLPPHLKRVFNSLGLWLYSLDDFVDIEEDRRINRITFMNTQKEPERVLLGLLENSVQELVEYGQDYDGIIQLMIFLTNKILFLGNKDMARFDQNFLY